MFKKNFKTSFKAITVAVMMGLLCVSHSMAQTQNKEIVIKAGTPIEATTVFEINSKTHPIGTMVDLKLLNQVMVKGQVVIPAGATIKGRVTQCQKHSVFGKPGYIVIDASTINAADGTPVPISGLSMRNEGKSRLGWAVVTGLTCLPIVGFLIPGQQGIIPAGSQLSGNVMSNTTITVDIENE